MVAVAGVGNCEGVRVTRLGVEIAVEEVKTSQRVDHLEDESSVFAWKWIHHD